MPWILLPLHDDDRPRAQVKSGACLGGHWDMTRRVARALGPFYFMSAALTILSIQ
jgi:hypothetical protein